MTSDTDRVVADVPSATAGVIDAPPVDMPPSSPLAAPKPRVWTVFVAYLSALIGAIVLQIVAAVIIMVWLIRHGQNLQQARERLIAIMTLPMVFTGTIVISQLIMGLAAIIPARLSSVPTRVRLNFVQPTIPLWGYVVVALSSILPLAIGVALATLLATVLPPDPSVQMLYEQMTLGAAVPFVLVIALAPGFMEELLFRGYMQRRLLERWSPRVAITIIAILFSLAHVMPHAILATLPLGFWLGVIAWKTGSVWPTIVCHAFVNGGWNIWNIGAKFGYWPDVSHSLIAGGGTAIGIAAFILSLRLLRCAPVPRAHLPAI